VLTDAGWPPVTTVCGCLSVSASLAEFSSPECTTPERSLYSHHSASTHLLSYSRWRSNH